MVRAARTAAPRTAAWEGDVPRLAGLDGLRALAVAAVVVYHVNPAWLPGGYLGVDVFFAISGFLITHLLVAEHRTHGSIALRGFWRRRAVRLLPELLLVLVACAVTARLTRSGGTGIGDGLRTDTLASLAFVNNWWQIHEGADYFHHLGPPPLLQHLWSLSVEEQFYLLWPLLLAALLTLSRARRDRPPATAPLVLAALAATAGAAASLWRMHTLGHSPAGGSRAYFGTDSHSGPLLAGCAAALVLPLLPGAGRRLLPPRPSAGTVPAPGRGTDVPRRTGTGPAAPGVPRRTRTATAAPPPRDGRAGARHGRRAWWGAMAVLAAFAVAGPGDRVMYGWGFAVVAVAATAVCAGCAASVGPRVLDSAPLRVVGRHSYGLYLWHWPVIVAVAALCPAPTPAVRLLELAGPFLLALAGGHLVQRPVAAALRARRAARTGPPLKRAALPAATAAMLAAVAAIVVSPLSAPSTLSARLRAAAAYEDRPANDNSPQHAAPASPSAAGTASAAPTGSPDGGDVTVIGDSVTLGSSPDLHRVLPGIALHAEVGRMMQAAPGICAGLLAEHRLRGTVVLALGTNAEFDSGVLDRVRAVIGPRRLVLTTVRGPFPWQDEVNSVVRAYHRRHPDVLLDDWYAAVAPHPDLLWIDHVHPRGGAGTTLFATSLADTLAGR